MSSDPPSRLQALTNPSALAAALSVRRGTLLIKNKLIKRTTVDLWFVTHVEYCPKTNAFAAYDSEKAACRKQLWSIEVGTAARMPLRPGKRRFRFNVFGPGADPIACCAKDEADLSAWLDCFELGKEVINTNSKARRDSVKMPAMGSRGSMRMMQELAAAEAEAAAEEEVAQQRSEPKVAVEDLFRPIEAVAAEEAAKADVRAAVAAAKVEVAGLEETDGASALRAEAVAGLRQAMQEAVAAEEFERAADIKRQVMALEEGRAPALAAAPRGPTAGAAAAVGSDAHRDAEAFLASLGLLAFWPALRLRGLTAREHFRDPARCQDAVLTREVGMSKLQVRAFRRAAQGDSAAAAGQGDDDGVRVNMHDNWRMDKTDPLAVVKFSASGGSLSGSLSGRSSGSLEAADGAADGVEGAHSGDDLDRLVAAPLPPPPSSPPPPQLPPPPLHPPPAFPAPPLDTTLRGAALFREVAWAVAEACRDAMAFDVGSGKLMSVGDEVGMLAAATDLCAC